MIYCPKCQKTTTSTTHQYHDSMGKLIRTEEVCDTCRQTQVVRHYQPKKRIGSGPAFVQ